MTLVFYINNIMLIRSDEQEMASILNALLRYVQVIRWMRNPMNSQRTPISVKFPTISHQSPV